MPKQEGFAKVNGTCLYYEVAGTGDSLVLIHGGCSDTTYWDDQFEVFAQRYKVIRYDRRGFGKSANPTHQGYSHFNDLKALLDYLGIAQAHILGHSDGCPIAVDFALTYPDLTRSLFPVSGGPSGFIWPPELGEEIGKVFNAAHETAQKLGAKAGNEVLMQIPIIKTSLENLEAARRMKQLFENYPGWHWFNQDSHIAISPLAIERLNEIKAPTCVIVGEREYKGNLLGTQFLYEHIANAKKVVIPRVGHLLNIEAPQLFNEAVLNFLTQA